MAINVNEELKKFRTAEDKVADAITAFAGNMRFVYVHSLWFVLWMLLNLGAFGASFVFDKFPFGLLTMIVSLEAIFLSTFVLISQNRESVASELRAELDYKTDVKAEKEIDVIMKTLERIARKQGVDVADLQSELADARKHKA